MDGKNRGAQAATTPYIDQKVCYNAIVYKGDPRHVRHLARCGDDKCLFTNAALLVKPGASSALEHNQVFLDLRYFEI